MNTPSLAATRSPRAQEAFEAAEDLAQVLARGIRESYPPSVLYVVQQLMIHPDLFPMSDPLVALDFEQRVKQLIHSESAEASRETLAWAIEHTFLRSSAGGSQDVPPVA